MKTAFYLTPRKSDRHQPTTATISAPYTIEGPPTAAQDKFIAKLLDERGIDRTEFAEWTTEKFGMMPPELTKGRASQAIEYLLSLPLPATV